MCSAPDIVWPAMRILAVIGKALISIGVGFLLFVLWVLYGTGLYTEREQNRLAEEFAELPALDPGPRTDGSKDLPTPPKGYEPDEGDPVFRLVIPAIGVDEIVVEGVDTDELRRGPGHYPDCRDDLFDLCFNDFPSYFPGELGRVIVSGHRTTYGQPFWSLNELKKGDEVNVETRWGDFTYTVAGKEVVPAGEPVFIPKEDKAEIMLTTCNPRFSAAERLLVYAEIEVAS
jgi:sortase A